MNQKPQVVSVTSQSCIVVKIHSIVDSVIYETTEVWADAKKIASGTISVGMTGETGPVGCCGTVGDVGACSPSCELKKGSV